MNPEQDRRPDPAPGAAGSVRDVLSDSAREGSVLESSRQHGIGSGRLPSATDMPVGSPLAQSNILCPDTAASHVLLDEQEMKLLEDQQSLLDCRRALIDRRRARLDARDLCQVSAGHLSDSPPGAASSPPPAPASASTPAIAATPAAAATPDAATTPDDGAKTLPTTRTTPSAAAAATPDAASTPDDDTKTLPYTRTAPTAADHATRDAGGQRALAFGGAPYSSRGRMDVMEASQDEEGDAVVPPPLPPEHYQRMQHGGLMRVADPRAPKPAPPRGQGWARPTTPNNSPPYARGSTCPIWGGSAASRCYISSS